MSKRNLGLIVAALTLAVTTNESLANVLTIDDFQTSTAFFSASAGNTVSSTVSGAGILGTRTMTLTVPTGTSISGGSASAGTGTAQVGFTGAYVTAVPGLIFDVKEQFTSTDIVSLGLTRLAFDIGSTLGVSVTITANGASTYSLADPAAPGGVHHSIDLTAFSDSSVFTHLTSVDFTITFPNGSSASGPSAGFNGPIFAASPIVPEPSSMILSLVGVGLFTIGRFRTQSRKDLASVA
jgi:hypothetical protein